MGNVDKCWFSFRFKVTKDLEMRLALISGTSHRRQEDVTQQLRRKNWWIKFTLLLNFSCVDPKVVIYLFPQEFWAEVQRQPTYMWMGEREASTQMQMDEWGQSSPENTEHTCAEFRSRWCSMEKRCSSQRTGNHKPQRGSKQRESGPMQKRRWWWHFLYCSFDNWKVMTASPCFMSCNSFFLVPNHIRIHLESIWNLLDNSNCELDICM